MCATMQGYGKPSIFLAQQGPRVLKVFRAWRERMGLLERRGFRVNRAQRVRLEQRATQGKRVLKVFRGFKGSLEKPEPQERLERKVSRVSKASKATQAHRASKVSKAPLAQASSLA